MKVVHTKFSMKKMNKIMKNRGFKVKRSRHSKLIMIYIHRRSGQCLMYVFDRKISKMYPRAEKSTITQLEGGRKKKKKSTKLVLNRSKSTRTF